jgi:hypothetical protein
MVPKRSKTVRQIKTVKNQENADKKDPTVSGRSSLNQGTALRWNSRKPFGSNPSEAMYSATHLDRAATWPGHDPGQVHGQPPGKPGALAAGKFFTLAILGPDPKLIWNEAVFLYA